MFHFEAISQALHDLLSGGHPDHAGDGVSAAVPADMAQALASSGIDITALSEADLHALLGDSAAHQAVMDSASTPHIAPVAEGVRFGHWAGSGETSDGIPFDIYDY